MGSGPQIEVWRGSITQADTEAIVNAANRSLRGGGGVDGAIHRAAGPLLAEVASKYAPLAVGEAIATPAFQLPNPIRWVIHTVGPVWKGGNFGEAELLGRCYASSLAKAAELQVGSIAFPAISTGAYRYPPSAAAEVAVQSVRAGSSSPLRIVLVAYDSATELLYRRRLGA